MKLKNKFDWSERLEMGFFAGLCCLPAIYIILLMFQFPLVFLTIICVVVGTLLLIAFLGWLISWIITWHRY